MLIAILFSTFQSWQNKSLQVCMYMVVVKMYTPITHTVVEHTRNRETEKERKREKERH